MSRPRAIGSADLALVAVLAGGLGLSLVVWSWGQLAGLVFAGGWPHVALEQIPGVLWRLPSRVAQPADAWPTAVRRELPRAAEFYVLLGPLVIAAAAVAIGLLRLAGSEANAPHAPARWARASELRELSRRWRRGSGPRLGLGRARGRLLRAERRHALVVFGPPQAGKSAGLAVPALLEWEGPVIASSIKTDLLDASIDRRRSLGPVLIFDPFELSGRPAHAWSPLAGATTWDGALEAAWRLASAGELDQRRVEGGEFWAVAAEQRLAPLMYAAAGTGAGMDRVVRWAYGQDPRELDATLRRLADRAPDEARLIDARAAYDAARAFEAQADRTRSSIEGTAQALLRAYRFNRVARAAALDEITPAALLDHGATLYLVGDAKASKLLRPIFIALISEIVDRAYERATRTGGRLERPLLVCLDEAGNVAPLPNLAEIASTAPSHDIQLISVFHDLAQARSRYGQQAETVINSHRARMLLPGVADLETLRYFSGLTGETDVRDLTRTSGSGGTTRSVARRSRPLLAPEALRQLRDGRALLLYGRLPPIELRLRLWFEDRRLRGLARR
jgi:type IV secretion system protein VirD4